MRAIGYARVSQVGQRDMDSSSYRTEQQQQDSIRAAAEKIGAVVVELIVERNVSGGTMSAERERAIQRIEAGDADCLIVNHPDRLARNAELALAIRRRVRAAGGSIVSVEGADADDSTPDGALSVGMFALIAEHERERKRLSFKRAQADALADGVHLAPAPFGYKRANGRRSGLVVDPDAAALVVEAFKMRAAGNSIRAIREMLRDAGHTISEAGVRAMLKRRTYLGVASGIQAGERPGAHEPIIDDALYGAAQLGYAAPLANGRLVESAGLRGFVVCAGCGVSMWLGTGGSHREGEQRRARYVCKHKGECPERTSADCAELDGYVAQQLDDLFAGPGIFSAAFEATASADAYAEAVDHLAAAKAERTAYVVAMPATDPDYAAGLASRDAAIRAAEARRDGLSPYRAEGKTREQLAVRRVIVGRGRRLADRVTVEWRGWQNAVDGTRPKRR